MLALADFVGQRLGFGGIERFGVSVTSCENNFNLKLEIHSKLQKLPRNSAKTRIRNRCWKTGRPRGVFRDFGLSRHVFREMAHQCLLPGVTKSSW